MQKWGKRPIYFKNAEIMQNALIMQTLRPLHAPIMGGCGPPTWALFGENVCKNERIGSHRGRAPGTPPRSANGYISKIRAI